MQSLTHWKRCWETLIPGNPDAGKDWRQEDKGTTEDEMVGWNALLTQWTWVWASSRSWWLKGSLVCCSPWGCKQLYTLSDWTELNWTMLYLVASVVSDSLWPHGLQFARLLCPWGFSRQEFWSGSPCPPPGDLPNPVIQPRSPAL